MELSEMFDPERMARGPIRGDRVRKKRGERGMSQTDLASKVGVQLLAIGKIERGKTKYPEEDTVDNLSRALEMPISYFYEQDSKEDQQVLPRPPTSRSTAPKPSINIINAHMSASIPTEAVSDFPPSSPSRELARFAEAALSQIAVLLGVENMSNHVDKINNEEEKNNYYETMRKATETLTTLVLSTIAERKPAVRKKSTKKKKS
jgi:transcriptional regulator with XRE-family HTH domain